jgi:hypothetical protein
MNKRFDTTETSDNSCSEDNMFLKQPIVRALGPDKNNKESFDTAKTSYSLYSEDMFSKQPIFYALEVDERSESHDPLGRIEEEQDEEAMCDKSSAPKVYATSSEGIVFESEQGGTGLRWSGHSDVTKVAGNSAASLESNYDEDHDDNSSSSTALWGAAVLAGIMSGSQWKVDKPFDEESIFEGAGESVLEFREYRNKSLEKSFCLRCVLFLRNCCLYRKNVTPKQ